MFSASLLPSQSVYESWSSLKEVRSWAAVDESLWLQFAKALGDEALDNVSLLAALQPTDVKEAIETVQGSPIARTKLRMVFAVARVMFWLSPVDVGTPPVPIAASEIKAGKVSRSDGGLSLRVRVSSILDQASDREVERGTREELIALRARFIALEGEEPMKSEDVTDDQLSVLAAVIKVGITPYADFGVWKPFGQRAAKSLKFTSHFLDHSGSWRTKEVPGPDSFATWEACWRVFRTAAIMCDIATPAVLDRYAAKFRERVDRFSDAWHLCVLADTKCRSELWESEFRRQSHFHDTNPEISAFVPSRPWNSVIRATANDRDFWKEELEDKVIDFRNVSRCIDRIARGNPDRSRSRTRPTKKERGREGGAHPMRSQDGRYRTTPTGTQVCFAYNKAKEGCAVVCPRAVHMSASFAWSHTGPSSVRGIKVGLDQSKVQGRAKARTGVRNDRVCSFFFCVGIIRGAIKRPLDSDVESVKTCSKTSEVEVCRSSALRGVPLDAMSLGGGGPPSSLSKRT